MKKADENIDQALDNILKRIQNENFSIQKFVNYSKILKDTYFKNLALHRKARECVFPGCSKTSIRKSHTISKSSSLANIAFNAHLLNPEFDHKGSSLSIKMGKVGLKNASIFPGYCEDHEIIFQTFETDSKLDNSKKALLQSYRSICRERVLREIEIEISSEMRNAYSQRLENEALYALKQELSKESQSHKIDNFHIESGDHILFAINKSIKYLNNVNSRLIEIEDLIYQQLFCGTDNDEFMAKVLVIDIKFPIALSGFATKKYNENVKSKTAYIVLNIIPSEKSTYFVCLACKKDKSIFTSYTDFFFSDPINLLNMVESFMINGSDHWYINPQYWDNLPNQKKEKILFDILNTQDSFLDEYPISIFNDIREKMLEIFLKNTKKRKLTTLESQTIKNEQKKIKRTDFEVIYNEKELIDRISSGLLERGF